MIADRHPVLIVERVTVRCDECPRQVNVFVGTGIGNELDDQLVNIGWSATHSYIEGEAIIAHYCEEHS